MKWRQTLFVFPVICIVLLDLWFLFDSHFYLFKLGSRYPNAAHYWPFNSTSSSKTLLDVRGKCKTQTYNGVRTTYAEQLGPVLSLDGIDDSIIISGIRSKCINDPTLCSKGLTVAFWLKYHFGKRIIKKLFPPSNVEWFGIPVEARKLEPKIPVRVVHRSP